MYDIVIVGAGPSGSRVALRMAENGFSVAVVDKKQNLDAPVCCTGIIGQECIDYYAVDDSVIYRKVNGATIFSPSGDPLHIERSEPQASILDRAGFNRYLAEMAIRQGAEYILSTKVTDFKTSSDRVTLAVSTEDGDDTIESKALVIADGAGSKLSRIAGFCPVPDFTMGAQAVVDAEGCEEVEVFLGKRIAPGFFGWLVPTSNGKALAGIMARRNTGRYMKKFLSSLTEQGRIRKDDYPVSYAPVPLRSIKKTVADQVLVVGSAAGQVKPVTGGGVYYGMRCADIAADVLTDSFRVQDLTEKTLSAYDKRWKRLLEREIKISYRSRRFYEYLGDASIGRLFNIIQSRKVDRLLLDSDDLKFDWHGAVILKLLSFRMLGHIVGISVNHFGKR